MHPESKNGGSLPHAPKPTAFPLPPLRGKPPQRPKKEGKNCSAIFRNHCTSPNRCSIPQTNAFSPQHPLWHGHCKDYPTRRLAMAVPTLRGGGLYTVSNHIGFFSFCQLKHDISGSVAGYRPGGGRFFTPGLCKGQKNLPPPPLAQNNGGVGQAGVRFFTLARGVCPGQLFSLRSTEYCVHT